MDFRARYQKELDHLRLAGHSFSKVHSQARHLAQRSGDPDVERLLEGFAFLSAKVQSRIDAGVPELIQGLTELLAPAQLRPIPSCTMLEFSNDPSQGQDAIELPVHTELRSEPVQNLSLRFRTTRPMTLLPIVIEESTLRSINEHASELVVTLRGNRSMTRQIADLGHLDLFVHGSCEQASDLFHALVTQCPQIDVQSGDARLTLHHPLTRALGLCADTPLLPWPDQAWQGQRLLAEYLTLPEKFHQFRLQGLRSLAQLNPSTRLTLTFRLNQSARTIQPAAPDPIKLHCCPAINLFECDSDPISQDCRSSAQRIRASGHQLDQFELYDVVRATQTYVGREEREQLPALFSSYSPPAGSSYLVERRPSHIDQRSDCFVRIIDPHAEMSSQRTLLSMELLCTHRHLPSELLAGQINRFSQPLATHLRVRDLRTPTASTPAPLHGDLQWQLFSQICAARCAHPSKAQLLGLLSNYNHQAWLSSAQGLANEQLRCAIREVENRAFTGLVQGAPVRGRESRVDLDETNLSQGQAYLFGQAIHQLLSDSVALNTLHRTELRLQPSGRTLVWGPQKACA